MGASPQPMGREEAIHVSVVVPLHNQQEGVPPLYVRLTEALDEHGEPYELIFVDDGSRDHTFKLLAEIQEHDARVHVIRLRRRFGATAALKAGFDFACGEIIVTMDGGLADDPQEIPEFLYRMREGFDVVQGRRTGRKAPLPGRVANRVIARASRVPLHDFACTFAAYRREVVQDLPLYGEMHGFLPALAAWQGARVAELAVKNDAPPIGESRDGFARSARVLLDFFTAKFLYDDAARPVHSLGLAGVGALSLAGLAGLYLLYQKFWLGAALMAQFGGLLLGAAVLAVVGLELLSLGVVSEMLSRTYFDAQRRPIYAVRRLLSRRRESEAADVHDADSSKQ